MNEAASQLGKLGKGKRKRLSDAERARRREALNAVRVKRWPHKYQNANT